jgi:ribosome-interacting GTPase 1
MMMVVIDLRADPLQQLQDALSMLRDWRIFPKGTAIPEGLTKPPFIKRMLVAVNKMDEAKDEEDYQVFLELSEMNLPCVGISVHRGRNLSALVEKIYNLFEIIRVFTRAPGKAHDPSSPFVLPRDSKLEELAEKVHKDFKEKLKYARVWGTAVYDGQMVQRDYILQDGDVVELHI